MLGLKSTLWGLLEHPGERGDDRKEWGNHGLGWWKAAGSAPPRGVFDPPGAEVWEYTNLEIYHSGIVVPVLGLGARWLRNGPDPLRPLVRSAPSAYELGPPASRGGRGRVGERWEYPVHWYVSPVPGVYVRDLVSLAEDRVRREARRYAFLPAIPHYTLLRHCSNAVQRTLLACREELARLVASPPGAVEAELALRALEEA